MKNAVFTWASGTEFCQSEGFQVFLKSLDVVDADVVFFTHDMPQDVENQILEKSCLEKDFIIQPVNPHEVGYPIGDRHLHYWRFLNECDDYDYILHVDCRDVVFQRDPFTWRTGLFCRPIVLLTDEGMPPSANGFHLIEQFEFQKDIPKQFRKDPRANGVLNGGVAMGTCKEMKNHFFLIWSVSVKMSPKVTDQATLNYLQHFLREDPVYRITGPKDEDFCLTGEGLRDNFVHVDFRDGIF